MAVLLNDLIKHSTGTGVETSNMSLFLGIGINFNLFVRVLKTQVSLNFELYWIFAKDM